MAESELGKVRGRLAEVGKLIDEMTKTVEDGKKHHQSLFEKERQVDERFKEAIGEIRNLLQQLDSTSQIADRFLEVTTGSQQVFESSTRWMENTANRIDALGQKVDDLKKQQTQFADQLSGLRKTISDVDLRHKRFHDELCDFLLSGFEEVSNSVKEVQEMQRLPVRKRGRPTT